MEFEIEVSGSAISIQTIKVGFELPFKIIITANQISVSFILCLWHALESLKSMHHYPIRTPHVSGCVEHFCERIAIGHTKFQNTEVAPILFSKFLQNLIDMFHSVEAVKKAADYLSWTMNQVQKHQSFEVISGYKK